jgi:hypothetical protein
MISLKEWMEVANYRITEGGDYYGYGGAYALTSWSGDQDGYSIEIIFSPRTQEVYEVQACDYKHNRAYRLVHGDYRDEKLNDEAWDNTNWIDLESDDDWIQKALSIVAGEDYDTRVTIPLDLPEAELMVLFKAAHAEDMTFNDFVEKVLREKLADEGFVNLLKNNKEKTTV